nr:hypothetical protein [Tanacetum cinerariifolium]
MCGTKVCEEQKQNMEDTMLELLEDCRQKELYYMHNDVKDLIESALNSKLLSINLKSQHLDKEKQEVKNIVQQAPKCRTRLTKCLKNFKVIHNESIIPLNKTPQISSVIANTPDLPTKEPEYSLSMDDEHLSTIPEMELDEVIKSSVKNLVPIPNTLIDSSPKFDYLLEEFSGELAHIYSIPPRIEKADFDLEEEICLVENLFNDPFSLPENESSNFDHHDDLSFPRPPPESPDVEIFFDFEPIRVF